MNIAVGMQQILSGGAEGFVLEVFHGGAIKRMVDKALSDSRKWPQRVRILHSRLVLWTVVSMSVFRSLSIANVFRKLVEAIRGERDLALRCITPEAVLKAKAKLGWEALRFFALGLAGQHEPAASFFGMIPTAIDGVRMTVPNSAENHVGFGVLPASRGAAGYPQVAGAMLVYTDT